MGVCNSSTNKKTRKINKKSLKSKKHGIALSPEKKNKESEKSEFLLPENLSKRDDINKYYKISSEILGQGASGIVCIGENSIGKFAIKRINKSNIKNINDIIKEAEFSKLKHNNIIKYYDVYEDLKTISFVMELGEGGDLFDFIINSPLGHLPLDLCINLLVQILDCLNYLHNEKRIIHRDLKPENFMITIDQFNNPVIKLIDFGFATYLPKDNELLNEFLGTIQYCSPEMINKCGYNEKTDIWSSGVILFNMITGCEVFKGESKSSIEDNIKFKNIDFSYIEDFQLRSLIEKMLEKDFNKRINTKDAFDIAKQIKENRDLELQKEMDEENEKKLKYEKDKREYDEFWNNFTTKLTNPTFFP